MTKYLIGLRSKTFKDEVTGMEDSSLQKAPRWEELEERWAPIMWWYYVMVLFYGNLYVFYFMEIYMFFISWSKLFGLGYYMFYLMMYPTHYSVTWHQTAGSLKFSENRKSYRETSLDMSGENRKFMMKWDFPDESSDCHVISDELVFEVKFVSKVCQ